MDFVEVKDLIKSTVINTLTRKGLSQEAITFALNRAIPVYYGIYNIPDNYELEVSSNDNLVIVDPMTKTVIFDLELYNKKNSILYSIFDNDFAENGYIHCLGQLIKEYPQLRDKYSERYLILTGVNVEPIVVYDKDNSYYDFVNYLRAFEI